MKFYAFGICFCQEHQNSFFSHTLPTAPTHLWHTQLLPASISQPLFTSTTGTQQSQERASSIRSAVLFFTLHMSSRPLTLTSLHSFPLQQYSLGHLRSRSGPGAELSVVLSSTCGFLSGLVVLREHTSLEAIGWDMSKLLGKEDIWCASQRGFFTRETKCFTSAAYDRFYIFSMMSDKSLQIKFC